MPGPDALHSAPVWRVYATIAAAKTGLETTEKDRGPCRAIRCETDGVLELKCSGDGSSGSYQPNPFKGGETQDVQAVGINSGGASTGCAPITIFW